MGDRCVSDRAYLAGMLIAIIGLSVLPATFIVSMLSGSPVGKVGTDQSGLWYAKPVLLDGFQGVHRPVSKTVVTEPPGKQATQTIQTARNAPAAESLQISEKNASAQEEEEAQSVVTDSSQSLLKGSDTASQGVYSGSPDLRLYSDRAGTQTLGSIDWGLVYPGETVNRSFYVKNVGSGNVTLSLAGKNWGPANANGPLKVTWDRQDVVLGANLVLDATLKLTVSSDVSSIGTTFGFDIVISGRTG